MRDRRRLSVTGTGPNYSQAKRDAGRSSTANASQCDERRGEILFDPVSCVDNPGLVSSLRAGGSGRALDGFGRFFQAMMFPASADHRKRERRCRLDIASQSSRRSRQQLLFEDIGARGLSGRQVLEVA